MAELNLTFYDKNKSLPLNEIDRVIFGHIEALESEVCDAAVRFDPRPEVKAALASEYSSDLSWYPFEKGSQVLVIGAGFGTPLLSLFDKVSSVAVAEPSFIKAKALSVRFSKRENLTVYAGRVSDINFEHKFDYIVVLDLINSLCNGNASLNNLCKQIELLKENLVAGGKVLLAAKNLFSLQSCQNGSLNPWNHLPLLSKNQILSALVESGFKHTKSFYPLPDFDLVGRVYTDESLPSAAEWNFLSNIFNSDQNFLSVNMNLLKNLHSNALFPAFAPSFFIEASESDNLCGIKKASVLFDEKFEVPYLGFDWEKHGYDSLKDAAESFRFRNSFAHANLLRAESSVLSVDEDADVLEKVQKVELSLLKKLLEVCERHNLRVFAFYGTLLGAVRNAGIIPGDDDIDVALFREDYDRLLSLAGEFSDGVFLQTPANDSCFFGGYAKLRDTNTTAVHPQNWWTNCCEGIGIDIFPLDSGFSDSRSEGRKIRKVRFLQRLLYAKSYGFFPRFKDMKLLEWKAYKYFGKLFSRESLAKKLDSILRSTDCKKSSPFGVYTHYLGEDIPAYLEKSAFEKSFSMKYEDLPIEVPAGFESVLKSRYGENYLEPLPWNEYKFRHGFYSVCEPYQVYKRRFSGIFKPAPSSDKKIVLFGDGLMFAEFFKKYKSDYRPDYIVLFDDSDISLLEDDCKTIYMADFAKKGISKEDVYPVLCALDIRSGEQKIREAGFHDYFIFTNDRNWILLANWTCMISM